MNFFLKSRQKILLIRIRKYGIHIDDFEILGNEKRPGIQETGTSNPFHLLGTPGLQVSIYQKMKIWLKLEMQIKNR